MSSRGVNKVILIGYLGQDPEVRYIPNSGAIANINLATSESWRDKQSGEIKEKTEWHKIVLFGKIAEVAGEYLHKGSQVYIEGSLQTRKWQDQNGQDKYITEIIVNINGTMQMLGSRQGTTVGLWEQNQKQPSLSNNAPINNTRSSISRSAKSQVSIKETEQSIDFDEDIPF